MIVFALIAAVGLTFTHGTFRLVVIMIGLDFFIASFAIGVGGTGWTLQGEVFPTAVRGQAAAFAAMIDWLANFLIIEVFPVSQNAISLSGVLVVFAGLCALAIVFMEVPARDQGAAGRRHHRALRAVHGAAGRRRRARHRDPLTQRARETGAPTAGHRSLCLLNDLWLYLCLISAWLSERFTRPR